jgi:ADP-ribose pyrophosphatase
MDQVPQIAPGEPVAAVGATRITRVTTDFTGQPKEALLVSRPAAVAVVPVDLVTRRVGLVRQRRLGAAAAYVLEVPAGKIDPGESSIDTARRELEEETGLVAASIDLVSGQLLVSPGYTDERMSLAIAIGFTQGRKRPEDAHVEVVWVDLDDLTGEVATAQDLKTYALLLAVQVRLLTRPAART